MEIAGPYSTVEVRDAVGLRFAEELMKQWDSKNMPPVESESDDEHGKHSG